MQIKSDGQNYAPKGKARPVCGKGEFPVGIIGLDHGHIFGMSNGLMEAGASLSLVYDPDPAKVAAYCQRYEGVKAARCKEEILENDHIRLIMSASVPDERCRLGIEAMEHGKDYFADKPPLITEEAAFPCKGSRKTHQPEICSLLPDERRHVEAAV